jgi:hypothetical protein
MHRILASLAEKVIDSASQRCAKLAMSVSLFDALSMTNATIYMACLNDRAEEEIDHTYPPE